jgi:hypothetical protein
MKTQIRNLVLILPVVAILSMTGCAACRYMCVAAIEVACLSEDYCSDDEDDCDARVIFFPEPLPTRRPDAHPGWRGDRDHKPSHDRKEGHEKKSRDESDFHDRDSERRSFGLH